MSTFPIVSFFGPRNISTSFRFVFINKKFVSFANVYILLLIRPYPVVNVFVSFRSSIILKLLLVLLGFMHVQEKKHFVSINFISKLKISLCKRFYSSYDQNLDSFKRFRFVSISKLYYRRTFMNLDIPTHDSVFCCFKSMKYWKFSLSNLNLKYLWSKESPSLSLKYWNWHSWALDR